MNKANPARLGYIGAVPATNNRDSDSWYTPAQYIESARNALGSIDLDPFSSTQANAKVKAAHYLTEADDALACKWIKRKRGLNVWMNPPYSAKIIKPAVHRLVYEISKGNVGQAIVLVNNATDTQWFQLMLKHCQAVCLTAGRISFENVDGKHIGGNTRGQAFLYFGANVEDFRREFRQYGFTASTKGGV
jgi:phage N-6-adenine-methyltransferase